MLLTGRNLFSIKENLAGQATWPEQFAKEGYRTFITGKWHNQSESLLRAFQEGEAVFLGGMGNPCELPVQDISPDHKLANRRTNGTHSVQQFADAAIRFLERQTKERPWLCYVAFNGPHDPRTSPPEYRERYRRKPPPLPANFLPFHPFNSGDLAVRDELLAPWPREKSVVREHLADYYAYVTYLDAQIGRVLQALRKNKQDQNTLVVFAADNGLAIGSHGLFGKQNVYEHSIHQPLIIAGPGVPANKKTDAFCYLFDVFPTLGELCGVPAPEGSQGHSLVPVLQGRTNSDRDSIFTAYRHFQRAVRDDRWKLVVYPQINRHSLFDLRSDPEEMRDLSSDARHRHQVARLTTLLKRWQVELGDTLQLTTNAPLPEQFDYAAAERQRRSPTR